MAALPRLPPDRTTSHPAGLSKNDDQAAGYDSHDDVPALRESLRSDRSALEQSFLKHNNAARLLAAHTRLIDRYLRRVWRQLAMPDRIALAAVGGYARCKLYPRSDIDLLILLDTEPDDALQHQLHRLIGVLWDIGLEVGHSVRTVEQCMNESADITVQTNLLEARLLCGNKELFNELCAGVQQRLDLRAFYLAKLQEQQRRHARYAEADYNLEPNLKESPGGLRDLQTVTWIARAAGLGTHWSELAQIGLLTTAEARQIARHSALLATLRIRLHYLAKRHEDRLLFDFQTLLAEQMGINASANRRASEYMMQRYYRTRLAVRQFNTIMLQNLHDYLFRETPAQRILNDHFRVIGTLLDIRDEQLFEHTPEAIFELFLLM
ncbi:MAG TPA: bifunctional uridylyltransferase/uridylyl-removing protein, partial [Gallionella sp.]|nr:bifunctional uridylyltransferase/uridylyl-removing protein [Gallionella sp.]